MEKTSLEDVRAAIGAGVISESDQGHDHNRFLCYTMPGQRLWLISSLEMNWPAVSAYAAVADPSIEPEPACPALPAQFATISNSLGLWLGAAQTDLEAKLGPNLALPGAWRRYLRERNYAEPGEPYPFDELSTMFLRYGADQRIDTLTVFKSTTT